MFSKLAAKYNVRSPLEGPSTSQNSTQAGFGSRPSVLTPIPFSGSVNAQTPPNPASPFASVGGVPTKDPFSTSSVVKPPASSSPFVSSTTVAFAAPAPSPFGASNPQVNLSQFGSSSSASRELPTSPSLFGNATASTTPFGLSGTLSASTPFGHTAATPFGSPVPSHQGPEKLFNGRTARDLLTQFYQEKNPTKVAEVEKLLEKYKGNEESLFRNLAKKYQLDPSVFGLAPAAPSAFGSISATAAPAFGLSSSMSGGPSPFGQSPLGFGQPSTLGTGSAVSSGSPGGHTFGAGASGGFGASSFGSLAQSSPSPFGGPPGGFGTSSSGFGSPSAAAFGSPSPFGAPRR